MTLVISNKQYVYVIKQVARDADIEAFGLHPQSSMMMMMMMMMMMISSDI